MVILSLSDFLNFSSSAAMPLEPRKANRSNLAPPLSHREFEKVRCPRFFSKKKNRSFIDLNFNVFLKTS